jgi:predicted  nucleic acid-binding Zn-ribbon protein
VAPIDPSIIFGALQLLGTIGGAALAVKLQMARLSDGQIRLTEGQVEMLRQLKALHSRIDHTGNEVVRIDKELVRVDERVKGIKDSQRFRFKSQAEQDMFVVGDE